LENVFIFKSEKNLFIILYL